MNQDLDLKNIVPQLKAAARSALRYAGLSFFVLVAAIYIFVLFRINALSNAQPDPGATQTMPQTTLTVNQKVADQLQQLEDNSVNVQSLFDNARSNPFQE